MAASKRSSTSSRTDTSADSTQAQTATATATAGMQQMFDSWMNAWRSLGNPAHRPEGNAPGIWWPAAGFGANGAPFAMPQMPSMPSLADFSKAAAAMSPFAGLKLPTAAIPPERRQQLQADYSRET